jgi:hypothetical protein
MDRRQRDSVRFNSRQQSARNRHLLFGHHHFAFGHSKQHSYRWPDRIRDSLLQGGQHLGKQYLHLHGLRRFGDADTDTAANTHAHRNTSSNSNPNRHSDSSSNIDPDTDGRADANSDSNARGNRDADADSNEWTGSDDQP